MMPHVRRGRYGRLIVPAGSAAALLLALAGAGCSSGPEHAPAHDAGPAVTVRTIRPEILGARDSIVLPGRVRSREEAVLAAAIGGRVTDLAREGESFRRGRALVRFDAPDIRRALESAQSALVAARRQREVALRQEARMDSLLKGGVASVYQFETAQADRESADAAVAAAEAALSQWKESATLTAPFDGVVVRREVDPGSTVGPGAPLLVIRSDGVADVEVSVPESRIDRLAGLSAELQAADGPWLAADVVRVEGMTDPGTRTRLVRFAPRDPAAPLPAGAFARVRLRAAAGAPAPAADGGASDMVGGERLLVPAASLVRRGGLVGVFVVESGAARLRWLRTGREEAGLVEVLAGLDAADRLVLQPEGLADGRPVTEAS